MMIYVLQIGNYLCMMWIYLRDRRLIGDSINDASEH